MQKHAADLKPFVKTPGKDPVEAFIDAHCSAVRCAVFHAKPTTGQALRPGALGDHDLVLQQLLAVQKIAEHLMKAMFGVRLPQGGVYHSGFGDMLGQLAPVTQLLFGPADCPTVEQLLAEEKNLPSGVVGLSGSRACGPARQMSGCLRPTSSAANCRSRASHRCASSRMRPTG